jgi:hypothetical protein
MTVGSGITPDLLTPPACRRALAGSPPVLGKTTAGRDFHPALRTKPACSTTTGIVAITTLGDGINRARRPMPVDAVNP